MSQEEFDIVIVGSGSAGVSAAMALTNRDVAMFDVGTPPSNQILPQGNLLKNRVAANDLSREILGEHFESTHNLFRKYVNPKLKAQSYRYVWQDPERFFPRREINFEGTTSFAEGGLANAWGAGALRFTERELRQFPIDYQDLEGCYDELSKHMGISGTENDDLKPYLLNDQNLLPPLEAPFLATQLLRRYSRNARGLNKVGIYMGLQRLAVLSREYCGRIPYQYDLSDFLNNNISGVYTPRITLTKLKERKNFRYFSGRLVTKFESFSDHVILHFKDLNELTTRQVRCKKLLLAMGCLGTTKCVLKSTEAAELKILDNRISYIPFLDLKNLGLPFPERNLLFGSLAIVIDRPEDRYPVFGTMYDFSGPMRSDLLHFFPTSFKGCMRLGKIFLNSMLLCQVFYPGDHQAQNFVRINSDDELEVRFFESNGKPGIEPFIIRNFLRMGYFSNIKLVQFPENGGGFHCAGTLPMKTNPGKHQTHADGRLFGTEHVYILDSSNFSDLPPKNFTFTIMANAYRIGRKLTKLNA